jgi:hypothetical protein
MGRLFFGLSKMTAEMNGFDLGILLIAIRTALPTEKLAEFNDVMYRGAMSAAASDALRFALGVDRADKQLQRFTVIQGGAA